MLYFITHTRHRIQFYASTFTAYPSHLGDKAQHLCCGLSFCISYSLSVTSVTLAPAGGLLYILLLIIGTENISAQARLRHICAIWSRAVAILAAASAHSYIKRDLDCTNSIVLHLFFCTPIYFPLFTSKNLLNILF